MRVSAWICFVTSGIKRKTTAAIRKVNKIYTTSVAQILEILVIAVVLSTTGSKIKLNTQPISNMRITSEKIPITCANTP